MKKSTYELPAGAHRAKIWQLMCFAFNNEATYLYNFMIGYISYFMAGVLGVATVIAGTLLTSLRIWDGITDPLAGWLLDRTESRFGKFRLFMVGGNLTMAITAISMIRISPMLPKGLQSVAFIVLYLIYVLGYTCQGICSKGAQSCLTNDPTQRPVYAMFEGIWYCVTMLGCTAFATAVLAKKHPDFGIGFFNDLLPVVVIVSAVMTVLAVLGISQWDKHIYYGLNRRDTGSAPKIQLKDYIDVLKNNKAVQMMVLSIASDRLAATVSMNATIGVILFGIICGNYDVYMVSTMIGGLLSVAVGMFVLAYAKRTDNKKALYLTTYVGIVASLALIVVLVLGKAQANGQSGIGSMLLLFIVIKVVLSITQAVSSTLANPMTGDCTDYEVYRSGRYCPGLIGTLYSMVDKLSNSLVVLVVAIMCAAIGFTQNLPTLETAYSTSLLVIGVISAGVLPLLGFLLNLYALKRYPLDRDMMQKVTKEIASQKLEQNENV